MSSGKNDKPASLGELGRAFWSRVVARCLLGHWDNRVVFFFVKLLIFEGFYAKDDRVPCIFLRWNRGLPRKLFFSELRRDLIREG